MGETNASDDDAGAAQQQHDATGTYGTTSFVEAPPLPPKLARLPSTVIEDDVTDDVTPPDDDDDAEEYDNVDRRLLSAAQSLSSAGAEEEEKDDEEERDVEVVEVRSGGEQWRTLLSSPSNQESRAVADDRLAGYPRHPSLSYKTWLLCIAHRRRPEIVIGVGLSLWLAFFVVLAIFLNGKSLLHDSDDNANNSIGQHRKTPSYQPYIPLHDDVTTVTVTTTSLPRSPDISHPAHPGTTTAKKIATTTTTTSKPDATSHKKITTTRKPDVTSQSSKHDDVNVEEVADEVGTVASLLRHADVSILEEATTDRPNYLIGVGRADITGPAADANMMGYANPNQVAGGIHMRQYARAFIIRQPNHHRPILFVNIDACMGSSLLKLEVLKVLETMYGNLYTTENLCISGTHTHSAPAGFLQDVLFQITSMGYIPETLRAMVNGIVESVRAAHDNVAPGSIKIAKGELLDTNVNRSPSAYLMNPSDERNRYKYNVDKEMTLIKFLDANGKGIGMINWFPVHATSMNNTNTLISGDNKGYAELLFEEAMDPGSIPGRSKFVAAFAQSHEGDVSPNTRGPHCIDTGLPCDNSHSTCSGKVQNCIAQGPGRDMFDSTRIIATNQYLKAMELYKSAEERLSGPVRVVHQNVDMTNRTVLVNGTERVRTCKPAMGFSFAAGTTDGPGAFDFKQGDRNGNAFWRIVRGVLHSPSTEQKRCHAPKPILVDTGEMTFPYAWQPTVVDTQLMRIGQLVVSAVPAEFTTMSGRRLMAAVRKVMSRSEPGSRWHMVVSGLANAYSDYVTTFEEYHAQRYEGASTIYGPHTLQAYIDQFRQLASAIVKGEPVATGPPIDNMKEILMSYLPGVVYDGRPFGYSFGDVYVDVKPSYRVGEVVEAQFVSGNPRNSPSMNMTFLTIEHQQGDGSWKVVHTDADWSTRFVWTRNSVLGNLRGLSEATVRWEIPAAAAPGRYRIGHFGHSKALLSRNIAAYRGYSTPFAVLARDDVTSATS